MKYKNYKLIIDHFESSTHYSKTLNSFHYDCVKDDFVIGVGTIGIISNRNFRVDASSDTAMAWGFFQDGIRKELK